MVVAGDGVGAVLAVETPLGLIHVDLGEHGADILDAIAGGGKGGGVDLDADGGILGSADVDQADAVHLAQLLPKDVIRILVDFGAGEDA